jgi:hypothetical protein
VKIDEPTSILSTHKIKNISIKNMTGKKKTFRSKYLAVNFDFVMKATKLFDGLID